MGSVKIPTVIAVTAWLASGLAVLGYTYIAFKETASDLEAVGVSVAGVTSPLVASANVLAADVEPGNTKPLNRGKFNPSKDPNGPSLGR